MQCREVLAAWLIVELKYLHFARDSFWRQGMGSDFTLNVRRMDQWLF
jgi:hypothetical protein